MSQNWVNISYGQTNRSDLCEENVCKITYPCPSSTYCSYYKVSLAPGSYLIYVYGAEGGGYDKEGSKGGKGGLSSGVLKLRKATQYFAYIGAKGVTATSGVPAATFGGGGSGYSNGQTEHTSSGGGASDLRTDANDFNSRIIVSGGGGGGSIHDKYGNKEGGHGSGGNGQDGKPNSGNIVSGSGAFVNKIGTNGNPGNFGFGGNCTQSAGKDGCGGGGGYYGGNAGIACATAGGGGSGFIKRSLFKNIKTDTGVRTGNGLITITRLLVQNTVCKHIYPQRTPNLLFIAIILLIK